MDNANISHNLISKGVLGVKEAELKAVLQGLLDTRLECLLVQGEESGFTLRIDHVATELCLFWDYPDLLDWYEVQRVKGLKMAKTG